jgi:hypothetical protein
MVLGAVATVVALVFVATASAGQVTKIMYAQENSDVYTYTNSGNTPGTLSVSIGWIDIVTGQPTTYPVGEVDGDIFSGTAGDSYDDQSSVSTVATLDAGTNPELGSYVLPAGQTAYIAVLPYAGDNTYTIDLKFNTVEVTGYPKSAAAYGSNGEVYVPNDGDWISCAQYWPGGGANPLYASWSDQVYQRVAPGAPFDTLSAELSTDFVAPQLTQRTTIGGSGHPQSAEWYGVTPQIWPAAAVPNTPLVNGMPQPGTISATTAPLWYTYSYPDASVTGNPVAYFWTTLNSASASKRNFSATTAMGASVSAAFSGPSITWVFTKGKGYGLANVSIDGVSKGQVSQYNSSGFAFQQTAAFSGLSAGNHTITITNAGKDPAGSTNSGLNTDAFIANGVNDPSDPTPVLENNYDGETTYQWTKISSASADGGDFSAETATGAAAAFEFTGTAVTFEYTKGKGYGLAHVYIDGMDEGTVSEFNASGFLFKQSTTFAQLANTTHILLITNGGEDPAGSTNSSVNIDAFIVGGVTYQN